MTNIQVTFTQDGVTIRSMQLHQSMATLIDISDIDEVCNKFRSAFTAMGEPLAEG